MKNFNKGNIFLGWGLLLIALITYTSTVEPTASFWDSGEFISSAYTLQIPHAPGAPLYSLVGHMFSYFAFGDTSQVAFWINMVSVISSALTIMILYWIIVMLGRKLFHVEKGNETRQQFFLLSLGGAIGALAYTFSDSFWFSAVETEVYAFSSFLSALMVWAILKWDLIDTDTMYTNLMEKFQWRGLDDTRVYYSDYYKGQMRTPRNNFNNLAEALFTEGDHKRAQEVLHQSLSVIPDDTIPYDVTTARTIALLLDLDEREKATNMATTMINRADKALTYYLDKKVSVSSVPVRENLFIMNYLARTFRSKKLEESAARFEEVFMKFVRRIEGETS